MYIHKCGPIIRYCLVAVLLAKNLAASDYDIFSRLIDEQNYKLLEQQRQQAEQAKQQSDSQITINRGEAKTLDRSIIDLGDNIVNKIKSNEGGNSSNNQDLKSNHPDMQMVISEQNKNYYYDQLNHAAEAIKIGHIEAAVKIYRDTLTTDPKNTYVSFTLANEMLNDKRFHAAEKIYFQLLNDDPNNMKILNNYLAILIEQKHPQIINKLKELEKVNPNQAFIPAQIGVALYRQQDYDNAANYFAKAVRMDPQNSANIYYAALSYELNQHHVLALNYYKMLQKFSLPTTNVPLTKVQLNKKINLLQE